MLLGRQKEDRIRKHKNHCTHIPRETQISQNLTATQHLGHKESLLFVVSIEIPDNTAVSSPHDTQISPVLINIFFQRHQTRLTYLFFSTTFVLGIEKN